MDELRKKCIEVFCRAFDIDPVGINDSSSPDNIPQWDSLGHVQLIQNLEDAFSIKIDPEEGIELESFKMVCEYVVKKIKG